MKRYLKKVAHLVKKFKEADFVQIPREENEDSKKWVVHVDGSSILYTGGIGVVLQSPEGDKLKYKVRL